MQIISAVDHRKKSAREGEESAVFLALEAVCDELGIARFETKRRAAVAKRIEAVWGRGRTQPLDLVDAGLSSVRR